MADDTRPPENPSVRHERTDASLRAILMVAVGAMVFAAVAFYLLLMFFESEQKREAAIKKSPFPLAPGPSTALPREPRLEQIDRLAGVETPNVFERESAKLEVLNGYGPTPEEGFIHVPIDQAMGFLADKLPTRPEPPADQRRRSAGLIDAGASNSGQLFRGGSK
jgi:hypothetical protein